MSEYYKPLATVSESKNTMSASNRGFPSFVLRCIEGRARGNDMRRLSAWISAEPSREDEIRRLRQIWDGVQRVSLQVDVDAGLRNVARKAGIRLERESTATADVPAGGPGPIIPSRTVLWYASRIAAVIVLLLGIAFAATWVRGLSRHEHLATKEVSTGKGQRVSVTFVDGSKVTLNSMSTLRFPEEFSSSARSVELVGEAYFDVARNEKAPFSVKAGEAVVKVLGTGFDIQAWPDDDKVEVVVDHGKVSVRSSSPSADNEVVLNKGEQSLVGKGSSPTAAREVDLEACLSWTKGAMEFRSTELREVLKRLSRNFDVRFSVADSAILNRTITGKITDESLNNVLDFIALTLDLQFDRQDGVVVWKEGRSE